MKHISSNYKKKYCEKLHTINSSKVKNCIRFSPKAGGIFHTSSSPPEPYRQFLPNPPE